MATVEECRAALDTLAARLAEREPAKRNRDFDRTLSCRVRDLDVMFTGRFDRGLLTDIDQGDNGRSAQIRLTVGSDDLVKLVDGKLNVASAWATGRMRVDAGVRDMIRLKSLF
jgi:hypothetical protein